MKKLLVACFIAVVGLAFVAPAFAFEAEFGGYWRTRAFSYNNFTGEDQTESYDYNAVDTRTRLYFTAKINDNLKFVNKFEFDADWGDTGYGDIGADGKVFEIKNTYADFCVGPVNAKVGTQSACLSRGFLFCDDFTGAVVSFNGGNFTLPFIWIRPYEGGNGMDADDADVDYLAFAPSFSAGDIKVNPILLWATSDDISTWNPAIQGTGIDYSFNGVNPKINDVLADAEDMNVVFLGLDVDANMGAASVWFTGLYETGSIDNAAGEDLDVSAYLAAAGVDVGLGMANIHGQIFYASGDDIEENDNELNEFWVPSQGSWYGQSYYWAEIMGYGMMDDMVSNGSCGDKISNIIAYNFGATVKPMDKLKLSADLWYATLVEKDVIGGEEDLGFEVDLAVTYELVQNLNLDIIGAYLFAGDRTTQDPTTGLQFADDANPYELGARLSLSF
ncbi:conserved exported hypothetical protein [Desulfamplus magnetovallimortis]|uniref:Alginate export domain-containing protein n=1 Tax=Desulfamplus magnetovallimortis TaxID=1246637 RepID=A0A1W1HA16_9BACT|nr:hypothetical protein [Desulfamplus magnetovallimortis]SLM29317.1 conserved exported hypothetical protein [Desulfamplus magnetovallimortis]